MSTPPDPWKSFRGVMAGTLILEAIVVLLALPVVATGGKGLTVWSGGYLVGLAVVLILMAGLQGRSWAIWVNVALQFVVIAGVVIHAGIGCAERGIVGHAEHMSLVVREHRPVMTLDASVRLEIVHTAELRGGERGAIAAHVPVERCVAGHERAFEGGNRA